LITPEALNLLTHYGWPGNIRELKNIIERMVVLCRSNVIDHDQVPEDIRMGHAMTPKLEPDGNETGTFQEMEKEMIRKTLLEVNRNKSLAAKKLGISRRTLYRKMEDYKIGE